MYVCSSEGVMETSLSYMQIMPSYLMYSRVRICALAVYIY